jgi:hypothetical protein
MTVNLGAAPAPDGTRSAPARPRPTGQPFGDTEGAPSLLGLPQLMVRAALKVSPVNSVE